MKFQNQQSQEKFFHISLILKETILQSSTSRLLIQLKKIFIKQLKRLLLQTASLMTTSLQVLKNFTSLHFMVLRTQRVRKNSLQQ